MAEVAVFALFGAFFAELSPWHGFCIWKAVKKETVSEIAEY